MELNELASYVGMFTGIAGMITGYLGYRASKTVKTMDLRIELKKQVKTLHQSYDDLLELMRRAEQSRYAVSTAIGVFNSGGTEKWRQDIDAEKVRLKEAFKGYPDENADFLDFSQNRLEQELINIHGKQTELASISKKYASSIQQDDRERSELRADMRERLNRPV